MLPAARAGTNPSLVSGLPETVRRVLLACAKCLTALAVTLACGLGLSLSTATAADHGCARATTAATRLPLATVRATVRCLINEERALHGLPPLRGSSRLAGFAQQWVNTLVVSDSFSHGNFAARIHAAGISFLFAGEDLGTGQRSPNQIVRAWMASADHCRNVLDPVFSEVGIGVNLRSVPGFSSGPATWAADFDLPIGHRSPSKNTGPARGCPYSSL